MKFKADEIVSVISQEIANYRREMDVSQVGRVLELGDGIAQDLRPLGRRWPARCSNSNPA